MNDKNTRSDQFLKEFAGNKNPFKTPENYLDNLSDKMDMQPFENTLPKSTGFSVPTNYFKTITPKIVSKSPNKQILLTITTNSKANFKIQKTKRKVISVLPYLSIAAVIMVGLFVFKNTPTSIEKELNSNEIVDYLALEDSIELDEIIDSLENTNNPFLQATLDDIDPTTEQLSLELNEFDIIDF